MKRQGVGMNDVRYGMSSYSNGGNGGIQAIGDNRLVAGGGALRSEG